MPSSKLIKFAEPRGYIPAKKFVYGEENGYTVSLWDAGMITVAAAFPTQEAHEQFRAMLKSRMREFKYRSLNVCPTGFQIIIPFNKKRYTNFLNALPHMLQQCGASGSSVCAHCRGTLDPQDSISVEAYVPCRIHKDCLTVMTQQLAQPQDVDPEDDKRHIGQGLIGALVGAIIGAIPWIIVACLGYISGWLGLVIGLAAAKGYELLGGKPCKAKIWVVIFAILVGIAFGLFGGVVAQILIMFGSGEIPGSGLADALEITGWYFTEPENLVYIIRDAAMALFFSVICCSFLVSKLHVESKRGATTVIVID